MVRERSAARDRQQGNVSFPERFPARAEFGSGSSPFGRISLRWHAAVDSTQIRPATVHLSDLLGDGETQTSATLCLVGQGSTFQMEIPTRAATTW